MKNGRQEKEEERDITLTTSPGAHSGPRAERKQPSPPLLAHTGTGPEVRIFPL